MGHNVVIIEPFEENILRIHKAVYLEYLQDKVVLVKNAISNKRNEIMLLTKLEEANIGGQTLMNKNNKEQKFWIINCRIKNNKLQNNKYLVETILLDDLVDYIPLNKYGQRHRRAINNDRVRVNHNQNWIQIWIS